MNTLTSAGPLTLLALGLWVLITIGSISVWLPPRPRHTKPLLARTGVLIMVVVILVAGLGIVAALGAAAPDTTGIADWLTIGIAAAAAVLIGGAVTSCVLGLADASERPTTQRVQRTTLRGGAWIGALERICILALLLAEWPEGMAIILAVKGLARYPELKSHSTGAAERFIIGTFTSIAVAAACAGLAVLIAGPLR